MQKVNGCDKDINPGSAKFVFCGFSSTGWINYFSDAGTNCMFGQSIFATEFQKIQAVKHEKAETALHSVPLKRIVLQISSKLCNFDCERGGKNLKDCDCFMHLFFF